MGEALCAARRVARRQGYAARQRRFRRHHRLRLADQAPWEVKTPPLAAADSGSCASFGPGGSRRPHSHGEVPVHWVSSHCLGCSSYRPQSRRFRRLLTPRRFGITSVPVVLLFKGGVMYSFHGGGFSVDRLMQFAERDYVHSSRMLVPPEPHVATPHDQTFLSTSRVIRLLGNA